MTLWQLCYTRGSVIPCSLSISCRDAQGLDLLSMPRAIDIRLERHISMDFDAGRQYSYGLAYETATLDVQSAVWWPMSSGANNRLLMGEIHLARDLKPSCQVGSFVLTVSGAVGSLRRIHRLSTKPSYSFSTKSPSTILKRSPSFLVTTRHQYYGLKKLRLPQPSLPGLDRACTPQIPRVMTTLAPLVQYPNSPPAACSLFRIWTRFSFPCREISCLYLFTMPDQRAILIPVYSFRASISAIIRGFSQLAMCTS